MAGTMRVDSVEPEMTSPAEDRRARFLVAFHRTRLLVYLGSIAIGLLMLAAGVVTVSGAQVGLLMLVGILVAFSLDRIHRVGLDRRWNIDFRHFWMTFDVVLITWAVAASGGIDSPWFIWYLTNAAAAAFVGGSRPAFAVTAANTVAYIGVLWLLGDIDGFDRNFYIALFRMAFMAAASYFMLLGISNAQQKRLLIRQMKEEESRKVEELTRLTRELHERTEELADANRRIREADRMKSQFLANMSHELRTPLNSVIGFSEILIERLGGQIEPKPLSFLNHILASGQHLLGIINDILDLSKIEAGKVELYPETFDILPTTESVCSIMRGSANKARVTIEVQVPPDCPKIETDPAKFKQILYNLLSNAVKFSPEGSTVTIRATHLPEGPTPEGSIAISVTDRGKGIAPEHHGLVFEEFRQVDNSSRREFGGTGLGLALVKKFVELQKGRVTLESELGKGSTFTFTLPVRFQGISSYGVSHNVATAPPRGGERILVVEDDDLAWDSIRDHIEPEGYTAIRARHADEALRLARALQPIAITLDLVLPSSDGWDLLKQLKADPVTNDIPVVIVSMLDNRELGIALGADDYFVKPVDRDRLLSRIRQISAEAPSVVRQLLMIDDDPAIHEMLEPELTRAGYQVDRALSAEEGLEIARRRVPHLIVLDLVMPGMSGFEAAELLKAQPETAHVPILVLTSKDLTAADRQRLETKIADLVPKGQSSASRLLTAIRALERRPGRILV